MRIVAGRLKGRRLAGPPRGDLSGPRPTADRVRESLFSVIAARAAPPLEGAVVLDLFAGTGALGLEALSRGADRAVFVDRDRKALTLVRTNVAELDVAARAEVLALDATRLPARAGAAADLVFLDPPYGRGLGARALSAAQAGGWIAPGALVVWEENAPQPAPEGFVARDSRRYGDTHVTLLEAAR